MRKIRRILPLAFVVAAGVCFLTVAWGRDDDKEEKENRIKTAAAQVDVLKLMDALGGKEDDIEKQAREIARKHPIKYVMGLFKPRERGGAGVGRPGDFPFDSVELELLLISKKGLAPDVLKTQKAGLEKMADMIRAVSYLTPYYAPTTDEPGKPIKDWVRLAADMKKQSKGLAEAIQGGDPAVVKGAAKALNSTCESCHTEFRDD